MTQKKSPINNQELESALGKGGHRHFGALDQRFLSQSIGTLDPPEPLSVSVSETLDNVLQILQDNKIGCVIVVDDEEKLTGIFSERDWILKVAQSSLDVSKTPVSNVMTSNPVKEKMDCTIAFALSLMSQGGFRHLPIVDDENSPVGIISVKDVVDHLVLTGLQELLDF